MKMKLETRLQQYGEVLDHSVATRLGDPDRRDPISETSRGLGRSLTWAGLAATVAIVVITLVVTRGDPRQERVVVADGTAGKPVPRLVVARHQPRSGWTTAPVLTGVQDYRLEGQDGKTRWFTWSGYSETPMGPGATAIATIEVVISNGAVGDLVVPVGGPGCTTKEEIRGHPGEIITWDGQRVTITWQEGPDVVALVQTTGYNVTDARQLVEALETMDEDSWQARREGVAAVTDSRSPDASWRSWMRTGTAAGTASPPVTGPSFDPCRATMVATEYGPTIGNRGTYKIVWAPGESAASARTHENPDVDWRWEASTTINGHDAFFGISTNAPGVSMLDLVYDDGILSIYNGALSREESLAVAAGVRRDSEGRFTYTYVPPGFQVIQNGPVEG